MTRTIDLHSVSSTAARTLLATGVPVYVPVNPVEFHGPHLPLGNDAIVCAGLVRDTHGRVAARHPDWPLATVPDLCLGSGAVPGPGTRRHRFPELSRLVCEACDALADLGATRVALMTFHGDPMHNLALQDGVDRLRARGVRAAAPMHALLRQMIDSVPADLAEILDLVPFPGRDRARADLCRDMHAGLLETSLTLHYAPDSVDPGFADLPPCPEVRPQPAVRAAAAAARAAGRAVLARDLDYAAWALGWLALDPFPGYTGRPALALPAVGAALAARIADGFANVLESVWVAAAPPPEPVLPWLRTLSLDGRVHPAAGRLRPRAVPT
jgi:creatinine amidohydrolase